MKNPLNKVALLTVLVLFLYGCSGAAAKDSRTILYKDDFSSSTSGWTTLNNASGSMAYGSNAFEISVTKASTLLLSTPVKAFPEDISVEVDARKVAGSDDNFFGVLCHYQDPDNYYMLLITSDGYSGITMRKDGIDTLISPGQQFLQMKGIKTGTATNHIRADCVGETLTLFANGVQVNLAYDHSLTGGDSGLAVRSGTLAGTSAIRFDNFTVYSQTVMPTPTP